MPPKILIVEDESIVALDLQGKLKRFGYQVVGTATSGDEAIEMVEAMHPDLAVMDIRLQGAMDGIETAQRLRDRFDTPVIYLTAHSDDATLQRAKVTEPFGYLVKPFEERELYSTLETALYRVKMEKRLQRKAAQLERVLAAIPDGVALLDADHRIVMANPQAQDSLALMAGMVVGDILDHIVGRSIEQLCQPQEDERWHEITIANSGSRQQIFEVSALDLGSSEEEDSKLSNYLLMIRDVTADRVIQQHLQVQDRLAGIGQFSAGIAHDFNNIISGIILSSQIITMVAPNLPIKIADQLESIRHQARRASDLIKQILDFSRASAIQIQPFELTPLLKEQLKMLERMLPENIRLEASIPTDPCWVVGDPTRILQVLMNLVLNARDAVSSVGIVRVEVSHISGEKARSIEKRNRDEWVLIQVVDNGTGIHPDVLPHIFEPFFTTKEPGKGTGLGLAQVYGIVQQHDGYIAVDSQVGRGTAFSVYFPCPGPSIALGAHPTDDEVVPAHGNSQTILVAEDNSYARRSISAILELLSYHVVTAADGREALAILQEPAKHVDLLLSDLVMPDMGGLELLRELRNRKIDVKTIILTGYTSQEDFESLRELGVSGYLTKPVDLEQLSRCVEDALLS